MDSFSEELNKQYYYNVDFHNTRYMGIQTLKTPLDLWVYQEIIYDTKPDIIIETGTYHAGTTLYLAHLLDVLNKGKVVSIDSYIYLDNPKHPRITYLGGDSSTQVAYETIALERSAVDTCLVILDSLHDKEHVYREMCLYAPLVSVGSYIIVEDTNLNGHPVRSDFGAGAYEAVLKFLGETDKFVVDHSREHYVITFNPSGYLKRVR